MCGLIRWQGIVWIRGLSSNATGGVYERRLKHARKLDQCSYCHAYLNVLHAIIDINVNTNEKADYKESRIEI